MIAAATTHVTFDQLQKRINLLPLTRATVGNGLGTLAGAQTKLKQSNIKKSFWQKFFRLIKWVLQANGLFQSLFVFDFSGR